MRLLVELRSIDTVENDISPNDKIRGFVWSSLDDSLFNHDGEMSPFTFSSIFPRDDGIIKEGDSKYILFSSHDPDVMAHIAASLEDSEVLNIGEMSFEVLDYQPLSVDVGPPGSKGVINTGTGVYACVPESHPKSVGDYPTFWKQEHGMGVFFDYINHRLQSKHDKVYPHTENGPLDVEYGLFTEKEFIKEYSLPNVRLTSGGEKWDLVVSKWNFHYHVKNQDHRRNLNLALDLGIGGRTSLGLGFLNIVEGDGL